jgi:hypothetical protein
MAGPPGVPSSLILGTIVHSAAEPDGLFRIGVVCLEECVEVLRTVIERMTALGWISS